MRGLPGFLERQTGQLAPRDQAVRRGGDRRRRRQAKSLFPTARTPYEAIEPVAESFGDLDPRSTRARTTWRTGDVDRFHRIEKALWVG